MVEVDTTHHHVRVFKHPTGEHVWESPYERILIGKDMYGRHKGNSILVHLDENRYVFIGHCIYEFRTRHGEQIEEYVSPIGNSDVPYPYAVGEQFVYFMLDRATMPRELIDLTSDRVYSQYYGHTIDDKTYYRNVMAPSIKRFRRRMIAQPQY